MSQTKTVTQQNYGMNSKDNTKPDYLSTSNGYQYVPTLKNAGYLLGEPLLNSTLASKLSYPRSQTQKQALHDEQFEIKNRIQILQQPKNIQTNSGSRNNSRIIYQKCNNNVIIHQHPSRISQSPSPIKDNSQSNIIPQTNFIYNASNAIIRNVGAFTPTKPAKAQSYLIKKQIYSNIQPINSSNSMVGMVPKGQYDKCVLQCRRWEQRYNQLYTTLLTNNNTHITNREINNKYYENNNNQQQYQYLLKENKRLKDRVRELELCQNKIIRNMDDTIASLVNKYRDSTLKQCMLLVDRYRLESKVNQSL